MVEQRLLSIYLRDHFAGATGGVALAQRTAGANRDTEFGGPLAELASEIAEDRAELLRLMKRLDVTPDLVKTAIASAFEKVGRLKPNGQLSGYSPLSRVVEIETLVSGVSGKLNLWRNLRRIAPADPRLDAAHFAALGQRAERQLERLHDLRDRAALRAFTPTSTHAPAGA